MAVPKKCTSMTKKYIHRNLWKKKRSLEAVKAFSLAKSISTRKSKSFFCATTKNLGKILIDIFQRTSKFPFLIWKINN